MTNFYNEAKQLHDNGYNLIPLHPSSKIPALNDWVNAEFLPDQLQAGQGVAVRAGEVIGVDIDIYDETLCKKIADYVETTLGYAPARVGMAPKILFVFKAADGEHIKKQASPKYAKKENGEFVGDKHQVEVLGHGAKFTCYQIHPDTGMPYEWVDVMGGLTEYSVDELPTIAQAQIDDLIAYFNKAATDAGLEPVKKKLKLTGGVDRKDGEPSSLGLSIDEVKGYIADEDNEDYQNWVNVGYAIYNELGADGYEVYDEWSAGASNYDANSVEVTWSAIADSTGSDKITMRTFIKKHNMLKHERMLAIRQCADTADIELMLNGLVGESYRDKVDYAKTALVRWRELRGECSKPYIYKLLGVDGDNSYELLDSMNELGNAERFVKEYKHELVYVSDMDNWLKWNGQKYESIPTSEVKNLVRMSVEASVDSAVDLAMIDPKNNDLRKKVDAFKGMSSKNSMLNSVVDLAKSYPAFSVRFKELDANVNVLGVGNGAVDLLTGELTAPNPKDLITINTKVNFNPAADCPVWKQTLLEVFDGKKHLVDYFKRVIGYSVTGKPVENKLFILYGEGANGKTTICSTIKNVLGGHSKVTGSETFASSGQQSTGAPREDILRLAGSRFVYVSELDDNAALRESLVKSVTGGEPLAARGLYSKHTVEVQPLFSCFIPTNHKPLIKNDDHGIWRRIELIPFLVNFDKNPKFKKDAKRTEKLIDEYEGILAWIIEGCLEYQKNGLGTPDEVKEAVEEYRSDMDLLAQWIEDCCIVAPDEKATADELWRSWRLYAGNSGDLKYISSKTLLSRRMSSKFQRSRHKNFRGFSGISVRKDLEFDEFEG